MTSDYKEQYDCSNFLRHGVCVWHLTHNPTAFNGNDFIDKMVSHFFKILHEKQKTDLCKIFLLTLQ